MSEYADNIDTNNYLYMRDISISEIYGNSYTNFTAKLILDSSNFNFGLARSDGKDFRLAMRSNGTGVLNMWIASWNQSDGSATIWFKIPLMPAYTTLQLYAFWGNPDDTGISDIESVDFLIADDFEGSSIDSSKWNSSSVNSVSDSMLRLNTSGYIEALNTPLNGITNWILECGAYLDGTTSSQSYYIIGYTFYGTENEFSFRLFPEGSVDRQHNAVNGSTYVTYNGTQRGVEDDSYFNHVLKYYEPTDRLYDGIYSRNTFDDYEDSVERQVYGDTRITYFRVYGRNNSAVPIIYIDWVAAMVNYGDTIPLFDLSNLYVLYEHIPHQALEETIYADDLTSTSFYHESSFGGNPYKLSDNSYTGGLVDSWISDSGATSESSVGLKIDFGRTSTSLVSNTYLHFDDTHTDFLNASKLSDSNNDINSNTYWQGTTTSGYAAIDFDEDKKNIGCLSVLANPSNLLGMIKDFEFYGSHSDPRFYQEDWSLLYTGTFEQNVNWQPVYFINNVNYRYYILKVLDTHGSNISVSEWAMFEYNTSLEQKVVSQLRIHPMAVDSGEQYFPKQIRFKASNDNINWSTLLDTTDTYTPFYDYAESRWQRYSFFNIDKYWIYKLECVGNWGGSGGLMSISEWSLHQKFFKIDAIKLLPNDGTVYTYSNIQALQDSTFDNPIFILSCSDKVYKVDNLELYYEYDIGTEDVVDFIIL